MTDPGPRPPPCLWSSLFDPLPGVIDFDYARPATFLTSPLPIESAAVQPAPVISLPAPSRSTAPAPANTIERRVGEIVAAAGMAIIEALQERADGGLTPATKMRGGDLICELFRWRKFLIADYPTFDAMAREHGAVVLRAAGVSPVTADLLASEVLDLLGKVVRTALN